MKYVEKWFDEKSEDEPTKNKTRRTNRIDRMEVSDDLMAMRCVDKDVKEMPCVTSKLGTVIDQCINIFTSRYIYKESFLQYLCSPFLNLEYKTPDAWFEQKMIKLDLVYVIEKSMTFCSNKDELGECEEGIPIVTDCALVNSYADKSRNDIHIHYIATALYYEGLGYMTHVLCQPCTSG